MKITLKLFLLLITVFATSMSANIQSIDLNKTIDAAIKQNKNVAVFFYMDNCGYCKRMKNTTFQDETVKKMIKKDFILIAINISQNNNIILFNDKSYSNHQFAKKLDVTFYPTVLFFDKNASVIYKVRGYRNSEKFQEILKFIQSNSYEWMDFFDFEKKNKE